MKDQKLDADLEALTVDIGSRVAMELPDGVRFALLTFHADTSKLDAYLSSNGNRALVLQRLAAWINAVQGNDRGVIEVYKR